MPLPRSALALLLALFVMVHGAHGAPDDYAEAMERGGALMAEGRLAAAAAAFEEAAAHVRDGDRNQDLLRALDQRAACLYAVTDLVRLRDVLVEIRQVLLDDGDELGAVEAAINLGYVQGLLGNDGEALALLTDAAERAARLPDPVLLRADALARASSAFRRRGEFARALTAAEEAAGTFRRRGETERLVEVLNVLGNLSLELGDPSRAIHLYREAVGLGAPEQSRALVDVRANMGIALRILERYEEAIDLLRDAVSAFRQLRDTSSASRMAAQLGRALDKQGLHDDAIHQFDEARALAENDALSAAYADLYAGDAQMAVGRWVRARDRYERSLETARDTLNRDLQSQALRGLADVGLALGHHEQALVHARESLRLVHEIVAGLSPIAGAMGRESRASVFDTAVRAAFASGDPTVTYEVLEKTRAAALLEGFGGRAAVSDVPLPEDLGREEAAARETLRTEQLKYGRAQGSDDLDALRAAAAALKAAESAYEAILDRIQRHNVGASRVVFPKTPDVADVVAGLAAGEVLVYYAFPGDEAHALVVDAEGPRIVTLDHVAATAAASGMVGIEGLPREEAERRRQVAGKALVTPLGLRDDTRAVRLSPGGAVAAVPFPLLFPDAEVVYVSSATVREVLRSNASSGAEGLLALGDPRYETELEGASFRVYARGRIRLDPLAGTREEVEAITREGDVTLLDAEATEERFKEVLGSRPRWRSVLLACHGLVDDRRPSLCALALTPGEREDGFLTALEVFGMRVNADLVFLSACDTGRGRSMAGDGLMGTTQAFMYAGAPRVIASLWKVPDEATSALVRHFYERWRPDDGSPGLSAAEALRAAQAHVQQQEGWEHPRYWAAWVLWGLRD
ncbi:MAG: CHAT domain-containing protein [Planctomycetota bacterium]|jgi:tetratricopeptide (TPR) repeat protein